MRVPPGVWVGGAAMAQWAMTRGRRPARPSTIAAALLGAASGGLAVASAARFLARSTTIDPERVGRATTLVTDGANALTRNPMYLGLAGILTAHALYRRSPTALLPMLAFVAVIDRWQIPAEEAALRENFGPSYEAYLRSVPRWLGPIR